MILLHDVEIEVRLKVKNLQHLIEHSAVLAGSANDHLQSPVAERADDGSELDDLRARAEHGQDAHGTTSAAGTLRSSITLAMRSASAFQS